MTYRPLPHPPASSPLMDEEATKDDIIDGNVRINRVWERWFGSVSSLLRRIDSYEVTWNPASVAANTTAEQTVTVAGLKTDMVVMVNKPSLDAGLGIAGARVSAADTLAVTFINATGVAINPGSEVYSLTAVRK